MTETSTHAHARLLYEPLAMHYDFGPYHPMHPQRLEALVDLLEKSDLWHASDELTHVVGRPATVEELSTIHSPDYIAAVQRLSDSDTAIRNDEQPELLQLAGNYGLDAGDTPAFPGMHTAAAAITGATLVALCTVMGLPEGHQFMDETQRPLHIFHPAGGWHHALPDRASGFCVYNDIAVAIAHILRTSEAKVAYIDFDAHHGDGVQRAFYDDPRVLTISLHESGRYLFPGTGDILELGQGSGRGYSVNLPLEPFTEDDSYIEVMNMVLAPLLTSFAPDVLITMHGCDTHAWDPLTHLHLSMHGIQAQSQLAHELAHTYCQGRWVAVGGGGYDPYRVVPRAWSMLWAEMAERSVPDLLPEQWVQHWEQVWQTFREQDDDLYEPKGKAGIQEYFPKTFQDRQEDISRQPRRDIISRRNRETGGLVRHILLPSTIRKAFPPTSYRSPLMGLFDLLHSNGIESSSRSKVLQTQRGVVLMRDFCPPSLVERLHADVGLHAFARLPEREHQLLQTIAQSSDCALTLAHTPEGKIIGQVTIAPIDEWWEGLENAYEVAIEVSTDWRGMGIAKHLLAFALKVDALEDMMLFAIGLSWHWDMEGLGITPHHYRQILSHLFASQGFDEYATTEPDIMMELANVLLVRIGKRVAPDDVSRFRRYLQRTPDLRSVRQ
jgi:acetoin utilization deacetylase AcuC-like enzyme/GNAT superfamily N-acetyltransferase